MSHEQLRRALEDARSRTGMQVGLPKVTVDASHLQHLLDYVDALERERAKLDCRYAGRYAEASGSHCPLNAPCLRCRLERPQDRDALRQVMRETRQGGFASGVGIDIFSEDCGREEGNP